MMRSDHRRHNRRFRRARLASLVAASLLAGLPSARAGAVDYTADAQRLTAAGDLSAARLQLRNAIRANGRDGAAHYQLGLIDLELGDPVAAEKEARDAQAAGYTDTLATRKLLTDAYLNQGRAVDLLRDFPAGQGEPAIAALTMVARGRAQLQLYHPDQAAASFAEARRLAPDQAAPLLAEAQLAMSQKDPATAARKVAAALAIAPNSPEALQQQAVLLSEKGDQDGAIAAANQAVAAAPGKLAPRLERAGVLLGANRNDAARADVDAVLSLSPGNARAIYYRALLLMRAGNFAGANADLDRLSLFISQYPPAYLVEAVVKQQLGQSEQALDAATRYVARMPGDVRGVILLARLQMAANQPAKAIEVLTPLIDAGSKEAAVYDLRGSALGLLGRPQEALKDYDHALSLTPDDPALLARAAAARLQLNQGDAAVTLLERSVKLAPSQQRTGLLLASTLIDSGKFAQAQTAIDQVAAQPGGAEAASLLTGALHLAQYDLPTAQSQFAKLLHDHPDSIEARLGLARVALLQGRLDDWISLENEVLQRQPGRTQVVAELVAQLVRQGRTADAIGVLERAHAAAPADAQFMTTLANLYISSGAPQKALSLATQPVPGIANGETPPLPWLLVQAQAQGALKQNDAVIASYRQILSVNPRLAIVRVQLVRMLLNNKDVAGARAALDPGLVDDPQNLQLLRAAIDIESKPGDLDSALAAAAKLDQDHLHQPASHSLQGDLYMGAKRYDDAAAAYAEKLKDTSTSLLQVRLAAARIAGGHADLAAQGLRDWLKQTPGDVDAEATLADLEISANHLDAARDLLTDVMAKRPNDATVMNNLAWVYQQLKNNQALELAQRAYRLAPAPETADTLGYIMATEGTGDYGVSLLRLATMEAKPSQPAILYHLAYAYQAAGQKEEAIKVLTPLVADQADFPEKAKAVKLLGELSVRP